MNLNTLPRFRHEVYGCFARAADALFNTVDALLTETQAHSFPELSLAPCFERRWCSLYEAFEDGRIERRRLQEVCVKFDSVGEREEKWKTEDDRREERETNQHKRATEKEQVDVVVEPHYDIVGELEKRGQRGM